MVAMNVSVDDARKELVRLRDLAKLLRDTADGIEKNAQEKMPSLTDIVVDIGSLVAAEARDKAIRMDREINMIEATIAAVESNVVLPYNGGRRQ